MVRQSRLYESAPAYVTDQPQFLNAALAVRTALPPRQLLAALKTVEVCQLPCCPCTGTHGHIQMHRRGGCREWHFGMHACKVVVRVNWWTHLCGLLCL